MFSMRTKPDRPPVATQVLKSLKLLQAAYIYHIRCIEC
jgi:hypothetical protein